MHQESAINFKEADQSISFTDAFVITKDDFALHIDEEYDLNNSSEKRLNKKIKMLERVIFNASYHMLNFSRQWFYQKRLKL